MTGGRCRHGEGKYKSHLIPEEKNDSLDILSTLKFSHSSFVETMHFSSILTQGLLWGLVSAVSIPKELLVGRDAVNCVTTPKSPKPRGTHCGDQGTISMTGDGLIGSGPAASQEVCRERCFKKQKCVVFGWDASSSTCSLYKKSLKKMGFVKSSSGAAYWHRNCYMRECTCPQGETKCQGACFDLNNDANNCGSCGNKVCFCYPQSALSLTRHSAPATKFA